MSGILVETFDAPAWWASYLVNGDASGLEPEEQTECDAWAREIAPFYVVDVARDKDGNGIEPRFERWQGLGRDIVDYVAHARKDRVFFRLERIRLNSGGYDSSGCYYGRGRPLYRWAHIDESSSEESGELRALSRDDAKAQLRERFPWARFYR